MYNKIYKCALVSKKKDYWGNDCVDYNFISYLLVKKTMSKKYFREIITGRLIPVCIVHVFELDEILGIPQSAYKITKIEAPAFIQYRKFHGLNSTTDLEIADAKTLENYLLENSNIEEYDAYLEQILSNDENIKIRKDNKLSKIYRKCNKD